MLVTSQATCYSYLCTREDNLNIIIYDGFDSEAKQAADYWTVKRNTVLKFVKKMERIWFVIHQVILQFVTSRQLLTKLTKLLMYWYGKHSTLSSLNDW